MSTAAAKQAAEAGVFQSNPPEKHTSGAKALLILWAFFAGDKSLAYRPNKFLGSL